MPVGTAPPRTGQFLDRADDFPERTCPAHIVRPTAQRQAPPLSSAHTPGHCSCPPHPKARYQTTGDRLCSQSLLKLPQLTTPEPADPALSCLPAETAIKARAHAQPCSSLYPQPNPGPPQVALPGLVPPPWEVGVTSHLSKGRHLLSVGLTTGLLPGSPWSHCPLPGGQGRPTDKQPPSPTFLPNGSLRSSYPTATSV